MKARLISLVCLLALVITGCGTSLTPTGETPDLPPLDPQEIPTQLSPATLLPDSPSQGDATQMPPSNPTPYTDNLQSLVEKARNDVAQKLSVATDQVTLLEATEVIWPNSSLGCPQKGMVYAEVLTPGYLILLDYSGVTYEYHASRDSYLTTCENPTPPFIGTPDNT